MIAVLAAMTADCMETREKASFAGTELLARVVPASTIEPAQPRQELLRSHSPTENLKAPTVRRASSYPRRECSPSGGAGSRARRLLVIQGPINYDSDLRKHVCLECRLSSPEDYCYVLLT